MISPKWAKVVSPAPRPSEGQGKPLEGGGLVPSFCGILFCEPVGHRDPRTHCVQGLFVRGGGVFLYPLTGPFFTRTFSRPRVFFFGLWGHAPQLIARRDASCRWNTEVQTIIRRAALRTPPKNPRLPNSLFGADFCYGLGGKCCPFFLEDSFLETFPLTFAVFQSSICLRFLFGGFFATNSDLGVRGFVGKIFGPKIPCFSSRKRRKKSSPFLSLVFSEFYFCYGAFLRKVLGNELRVLYWSWFCLVQGVRFCMDLLI